MINVHALTEDAEDEVKEVIKIWIKKFIKVKELKLFFQFMM